MRGGTLNVPAIVGFAEALEKTTKEMAEARAKIEKLQAAFLLGIAALDGVKVNGEGEEKIPAVLSLQVSGVRNDTLLYRADLEGLCLAAGSACASASVKPSHVLLAMGRTDEEARQTVRISFGNQNTEEEVKKAAQIFVETVKSLRKN